MPSAIRLAVASLSGLMMTAALLTTAPAATAATPEPTPTAGATSTPAPTSGSAPTPSDSPSASPAPTTQSPAANGVAEDPSLAEQNSARNHAMGSTIAAHEPTATPANPSARSFSQLAAPLAAGQPAGVQGLDVSGWQVMNAGTWAQVWANGGRFAYVKATEATDYVSSQFSEQYNDSYNAGLVHGAYHFATPNTSSGSAQANWFLNHGGQGTADGRTLPPLLDIEYNPYGATCYGLSAAAMVSWIQDFSNTIIARTGKFPAIYSTTNWWSQCTGNSAAFYANPLFIARYPNSISDGPGTLPASWSSYMMWQYADSGIFPGDQDVFNGSYTDLQLLGLGTSLARTAANPSVYVVSGGNKYPVTDMLALNALSPLGAVAFVPQSFLDQFATQQAAGRIVRAPDGGMYFYDAGSRLHLDSCDIVAAYGGSCSPSGYMQLSTAQVARYVNGPAMTPLLNSSGGPLWYVAAAQKHEVLDTVSEQQAGIQGPFNTLSATALNYLPTGTPVVRDGVYANQTGTSTGVLLNGGTASPVDANTAATTGLVAKAVGSLQPDSIAKLTAGRPFIGAIQQSGSSTVQVAASDGVHPWPAGLGGAAFQPVVVPSAVIGWWTAKPAIATGSAIMSTTSPAVYLVESGNIRPVSSWDALVALSGGSAPAITVVPQPLIDTLPKGPVALLPGLTARTAGNPSVYLVNGLTNKIPMASFDQAVAAGFTQFAYAADDALGGYPTSSSLLGFGLICGSQKYVSAGGSIHAVSSSLTAQYPFTYLQLDSSLCKTVTTGINATAFIRTPDGAIYQLAGGQKHHISSMAQFNQLAAGQPYLDVLPSFAGGIPTGAAA
jgi:GH25 family lysozyme M1 (1,4-beta-N-acetylmuramidase)